jgi:hypothetical protein
MTLTVSSTLRERVCATATLLGDHDVVGRDVAIGPQSMQPFPGIGRLPVLLVKATDLVRALVLGIGRVANLVQLLQRPRRIRNQAKETPAPDHRRRHIADRSRLADRGDQLGLAHRMRLAGLHIEVTEER